MKNEIKLIVSDIDGTLIDDNGKSPKMLKALLDELERQNIIFVAASGRSTQSIKFAIKEKTDNLYYISNNGAILEYQDEIAYINKFSKEEVKEIMEAFRQTKEASIVATASEASYIEIHPSHDRELLSKFFYGFQFVDDITNVDDDIVKISLFSHNHTETNYQLEEIQNLKEHFHLVRAGANYIDATRLDSNKGNALETLLSQLEIDPKNTIGFGDYHNDIHMLEVVGKGYAMQEAHPDVKLVADEVIGSNNDNSVMNKIVELLDLDI